MNPRLGPLVAAAVAAAVLAGCGKSGQACPCPVPSPVPGRAAHLYVAAGIAPGLLARVPPTSSGTVTPSATIASSVANFGPSYFAAIDGAGRLWVTSCSGTAGSAGPLLAFNASAAGTNVNPAVAISGANTGLQSCQLGVAADTSGNVYVTDNGVTAAYPGGQIAVFSAGQTGDVHPVRRIAGGAANLRSPAGLAVDGGGEVFVADTGQGFAGYPGDVQVFGNGASGNVASIRTIAGSNTGLNQPYGVALDASGDLYVTNQGNDTIVVFAPGATGNVKPLRTIGGAATLLSLPSGVAVDRAGYVYVGTQSTTPANAPVLVFGPNAGGDVAPVQAITIDASRFAEPSGIALQ